MTIRPGTVTIIRGGRLLDARAHRADPGDILVTGNTISEIGPPGLAAPAGAVTIDARGMLVHPGLINAHTHGHGNLAKGMGDRWTLELLLTAAPWINGNRSAEDRLLSAKIGAVEMVLKGCTAAYDLPLELPAPTHEGVESLGRVYADVGMRAVIAPMVADRTMYEAIPGLMDVLSPSQREDVAKLQPVPWKTNGGRLNVLITPALPDAACTAGRSIVSRSASRWRRRFRITARTSSSAAARISPRSTASVCTATWPSPRCRRSSGCSATARRSLRISTALVRSDRTSLSPTGCGSTTTI